MGTQILDRLAARTEATASEPAAAPQRLLSLDVFRGFTLLSMVLVNSHPGPIYPAIAHAVWHGWTFTDLIFPFFVFITGVAIPYSFAKRIERGETGRELFLHILKRCVLLFAVGMFLNGYPSNLHLSSIRVMNVLQRIAVCYFLASMLYVYLRISRRTMVMLSAAILVGYFALMAFVPVPGYGVTLEPIGNWGNYIDQHLLAGHMQHKDKEAKSLLGTFPALVTMLMGLLTGLHLRDPRPIFEKLTNLFFYGSVCMAAGAIWSIWFPVNQKLWSSSLVLLMGGMAMVFLASFYYLCDIKKSTWWTLPCLIYGANSVAVWIFSQFGMKTLTAIPTSAVPGATDLWHAGGVILSRYLGDMNGSLAFAILYDLFWLSVLGVMYRRRIFLKF